MATNDEAGAVALAEYFITDLYQYTFATGDATEWSAISDDGCNFCNSILAKVEEMAAAEEHASSEPTVVESSEVVELIEGTRYGVTLVIQQGASRRLNAAGETTGTSDSGRYTVNYALGWNGEWSILAVDATPTST